MSLFRYFDHYFSFKQIHYIPFFLNRIIVCYLRTTVWLIIKQISLATPEEQQILSEYVGWGGLADAFDETKPNWANEFQELYAALSPEEYEQARASTLTSHYTSPVIIKSMYKALENMGFSQGNILEPSCGIGNFMGLVPESMKDSKIYGIEIDSITGRIAQQLYQRNSVAIQGYEDTTLPDSFFDVAIGNPADIYGLIA